MTYSKTSILKQVDSDIIKIKMLNIEVKIPKSQSKRSHREYRLSPREFGRQLTNSASRSEPFRISHRPDSNTQPILDIEVLWCPNFRILMTLYILKVIYIDT